MNKFLPEQWRSFRLGVSNRNMTRLHPSLLLAAMSSGAIMTSSLVAQADVEIGGTVGAHVFNHNNELGVDDLENAPSQRNSILLALRLGAYFNDVIGVEGEFGVIPTVARDQGTLQLGYSITNLTYRAHLIAQFRAADPAATVLPFVLIGAGGFSTVSSSN